MATKRKKEEAKKQRNIVEKELAGQGGKQNYKTLQTKNPKLPQ